MGVANLGIRCRECGSEHGCRDGLCRGCRCRARRKYRFAPDLLEDLRRAYRGTKREIGEALDRLVLRTGWPRFAFKCEALRRGWTTETHRRAWTPEEIEYLREEIGVTSLKRIARNLKRSVESIEAKCEKLHLSRQRREGYNLTELQQAFGAPVSKVRRWVERGLLGTAHHNGHEVYVTEAHVVRFIRRHASEYDLRRVNQGWFKGMLFGELAEYGGRV
jgi:hypothetical protein